MIRIFNAQRRLLAVLLASVLFAATAACSGGPSGMQSSTQVTGNPDLPKPEKVNKATPQLSDQQPQQTKLDQSSGSTPALDTIDPAIDDSAVKDREPMQEAEDALRNSKRTADTQPPVAKEAEKSLKNTSRSVKAAGENAKESVKSATEDAAESAQSAGEQAKESVKNAGEQVKESAQETGKQIEQSAQRAKENVKQAGAQARDRIAD